MPHPLDNHPYFTRWQDPESGAVSYVLTEAAAPVQKGMYFQNHSLRGDGKWLWFRGMFPPAPAWVLCAVSLDPDDPQIRTFHHSQIDGNPWIEAGGDTVVVPTGDSLYRYDTEGHVEELWHLPEQIRKKRLLTRLTTTLTPTCDGKYWLMDTIIGNRWLVNKVDRESGELTELGWFHNAHHHVFSSPVDPTLFAVAQNHWIDHVTGEKNEMHIRLWWMDTEGHPLRTGVWGLVVQSQQHGLS